ncbi:hypothetical protein Ancab_022804 [Ancistrocladus abbreviatus]
MATGLFHGGGKINGAPRRTSGYAKVGRTNQLPGPSIRWEAGVVVKEVPIPDYVLVSNTSSQSCLPSLVEDPSVLMKLVQGKSPSMVDPRKENDQPELQTDMAGSVAGKAARI